MTNPYLAYTLLIYAAIDGIKNKKALREPVNYNLYTAPKEVLDKLELLPETLEEAKKVAKDSEFIKKILNQRIIDNYLN
jgi:glutamine synthetase